MTEQQLKERIKFLKEKLFWITVPAAITKTRKELDEAKNELKNLRKNSSK